MGDRLNELLKWSIENSTTESKEGNDKHIADGKVNGTESSPALASATATTTTAQQQPRSNLNPEILQALFGGSSDADLMRESMTAILAPSIPVSEKLIAFDNFEQLIENLDNANNMASLGLWTPLIEQVSNPEASLRKMAAWCVGTAVQNNPTSQERALVGGAVGPLLKMLKEDEDEGNRRKARYAVSSLIRNYQPGMDAVLEGLADGREKVDASDMEAVDKLLEELLKR